MGFVTNIVLAHLHWQLDGLDQREAEDVGVEVDRPFHIAAHQCEVVHAADVELAVLARAVPGHGPRIRSAP